MTFKKPFVCSTCGQNFSTKNSMSIHNESVHEDKGPFKCDFCEVVCKTKVGWIVHIAGVHERKIQCIDCDKNLPRKYNLKTHKALA